MMYNYKDKQRQLTKEEISLIGKFFMNDYHDGVLNALDTKYNTYEDIVIELVSNAFTIAFDLPECGGTFILLLEGFQLDDDVVDKNVEHIFIKDGVVEIITDHDFIEKIRG